MTLKGKAAIVGIYDTKLTKSAAGTTILRLLAEAAKGAIESSGLEKKDIDGLVWCVPWTMSMIWVSQLAEYLQLYPKYHVTINLGGGSPGTSLITAASVVQGGVAENVLCLAGDAIDTVKFYQRGFSVSQDADIRVALQFETPFGPMGMNSAYALVARRHMHEFGTTSEQLAKVAVDQRFNALANPNAIFQTPIKIEDVLRSRMVVDPLHLLDIVMPVSGASGVVVTSAERAEKLVESPVYILGAGACTTHQSIAWSPSVTTSPIKVSARGAFSMAGLEPRDMDFTELYDCYTITVVISLEDAGFCAKGEGGRFVEKTDLTYKGELPLNTHGGELSAGQPGSAGFMIGITEAVRQLRGKADRRQVPGARYAFLNSNGGVLSVEASLVLGSEVPRG